MIKIRHAVPGDAGSIVEFQVAMALETESIQLDRNLVTPGVDAVFSDPSKGEYFVAEDNGEIVASLLITCEWSDWRNASVWWFQSVYVIPRFRRKGIFSRMYSFIREEAEKNNVAGLRLYVETRNKPAQATYEAMGMTGEHYKMYEWLK
ncbi:MAG TPA: GNAT family N-acetyltransferase [Bacteroidales bacterium]|nr:GNAT family N-acetyltransferase [Bacteroidales bacterium]